MYKSNDIPVGLHGVFGLIVCILSFGFILSGCFEESFVENPNVNLEFSVDTLRFDTVFTTVGSATRSVKVFNRSNENITLQSISLKSPQISFFRLNIDGIASNSAENIDILANDSLYVFVEVTIDPDQPVSASPFIIHDQIIFNKGPEAQNVTLEAWGQNANYFPSKDAKGNFIRLTCGNGDLLWDDDKPYVVYGLLFIDSCSLIISPGTDVYFHGGLARIDEFIFSEGGLVFLPSGRMEARGTLMDPINFQGDRLESAFDVSPGQWPGIRFVDGSRGNQFDHAIIQNSVVGIRADSSAEVSIANTRIFNTSNAGLIGIHADLTVDNSLIHSSGGQGCILAYGGNYTFRHCTIANYENQAPAVYMDNFICRDANCQLTEANALQASFFNSIIAGSNGDEVSFADITDGAEPALFQVNFDHTLVRIDEEKSRIDFGAACNFCIEYSGEALFIDEDNDQYMLDTMSIALGQGIFLPNLPEDILGRTRDTQSPDLGCFEFQD